MKLETFFNKFDELANTPNGVKQLRELVMQLAVEGGLVPHSAAEPAVPYASVEDAKSINVSDVPANWRVVLLANAIKNRSGNSKLIKGKLHEEPAAGRFQGFSASGADVWCDDYEHEGQAIIISAVGARCGKAFKASGKWCAIANTNITRPEPTLFEFDFAYLVLNNEHFWVRGGSAQPFVKFPPSLDRHFALPPLAEQKRIVAKVDELMALCDRLEAQQQERETRHAALARASLARFADAPTPANLPFLFHPSYAIPPADLRKSILTLAVQGKLVPQDPNDEPVEDSLARNDKRRCETARSDHRADEENQPLLSADDRWDIGETWSWRGLADLVLFVDYRGKTPAKLSSGVRLLTAKNVRKGQINLSPEEFLSASEYQAWMTRGFPKAGDVLFTTEAPMGNAAVVELTERFALAQRVICFQSYGALEPAFLVLQILSDQFQFILDKNGTGVTAKGIKASKLKQLPIAIPPLAEQRRIVAKVSELMALVDALETQLAASRATAANLLSALVAELTTPKTLLGLGMTNGRLSPTKP